MSDRKEEYKYQEKALTLVTEDPSNGSKYILSFFNQQGFIINKETIEFIKTVPEPLAIISVAGLYRTGKSYLLNRMLLNTKSGFGVASTVNPCTKVLMKKFS
jgi:Guanylate-binding protein, N-terminal domain